MTFVSVWDLLLKGKEAWKLFKMVFEDCFVDFKKAFDSIWHDGLLHKLLYKNIGGQFYHLRVIVWENQAGPKDGGRQISKIF